MESNNLFQRKLLGKLAIHMQKRKEKNFMAPCTRSNTDWCITLYVRPKARKTLENFQLKTLRPRTGWLLIRQCSKAWSLSENDALATGPLWTRRYLGCWGTPLKGSKSKRQFMGKNKSAYLLSEKRLIPGMYLKTTKLHNKAKHLVNTVQMVAILKTNDVFP